MNLETTELEYIILQLTIENTHLKALMAAKEEPQIFFWEHMLNWLVSQKSKIRETSYIAYKSQVEKHIVPFFKALGTTINQLTPEILEQYYSQKLNEDLTANTICKHHANIHSALKIAVRNRTIMYNVADAVDKPKILRYRANYLSQERLNNTFNLFSQTKFYLPILIAGVMGLRRSEVLGLKWNAIDFEKKTLEVRHTLVKVNKDHKTIIICSDLLKTSSSYRILPIPDKLISLLKIEKKEQVLNYMKNPKMYGKEYLGYLCLDKNGSILKPDSVSNAFSRRMLKNGQKTRFHDLRHTCASILASLGLTLKEISEWLGHSSISVTSDIYIHLFYQKKVAIAEKINEYIIVRD